MPEDRERPTIDSVIAEAFLSTNRRPVLLWEGTQAEAEELGAGVDPALEPEAERIEALAERHRLSPSEHTEN